MSSNDDDATLTTAALLTRLEREPHTAAALVARLAASPARFARVVLPNAERFLLHWCCAQLADPAAPHRTLWPSHRSASRLTRCCDAQRGLRRSRLCGRCWHNWTVRAQSRFCCAQRARTACRAGARDAGRVRRPLSGRRQCAR